MRRANTTYAAHARRLLRMMHYVASHGGVTPADIAEHIGVAAPTVYRCLLEIRDAFGARIAWDRRNAEYCVISWGVLNRQAVQQLLKKRRARRMTRELD